MASRRASNRFKLVNPKGSHSLSVANPAKYHDKRLQAIKAKDENYVPCPRCGRLYRNPHFEHYADYKNKIRCMEPIR